MEQLSEYRKLMQQRFYGNSVSPPANNEEEKEKEKDKEKEKEEQKTDDEEAINFEDFGMDEEGIL